jgi:hypothetical protein
MHRQGKAFSSKPELLVFAEEAVRYLEASAPSCIANGLLRVDIMQRRDGSLIVNEFESLEALFDKKEDCTQSFLASFWLSECIKMLEF